MKKRLLVGLFCFCALVAGAQFTTNNAALDKRLNAYMQLTRELNFEKIMDYMHPSLFKIAPREMILQSFEQLFQNPGMKVSFDSIQPLKASAPFAFAGVTYRRIDYFMRMSLQFSDTAIQQLNGFPKPVIENLQKSLPGKEVVYDKERNAFVVSGTDILLALKDAKNPDWMFLGYQKNTELLQRLYPKEVITHFKLL